MLFSSIYFPGYFSLDYKNKAISINKEVRTGVMFLLKTPHPTLLFHLNESGKYGFVIPSLSPPWLRVHFFLLPLRGKELNYVFRYFHRAVRVGVLVRGCVGVWVCGCVDVGVFVGLKKTMKETWSPHLLNL